MSMECNPHVRVCEPEHMTVFTIVIYPAVRVRAQWLSYITPQRGPVPMLVHMPQPHLAQTSLLQDT